MQKKTSAGHLSHLHHHDINATTIRDSMQYYRVWIYSCNSVLGITSAIFTVVAAFVLADVRLSLFRDVELYHPTFLYAYAALILQCGVVQVIGCLGAQRLSHKLLSLYWALLLLLTVGDVVVGIVWVFKLERVKLALRPSLTQEFLSKYSRDALFTHTWNRVQAQEQCCGVTGPLDFSKFPPELRTVLAHDHADAGPVSYLSLPDSCCTVRAHQSPTSILNPPSSMPFPLSATLDRTRQRKDTVLTRTEKVSPTTFARLIADRYSSSLVGGNSAKEHRRVRHVVNRKQVPPRTHDVTHFDSSVLFGETSHTTTEEPAEVSDISVPFICRNPEKYFSVEALTQAQKRESLNQDTGREKKSSEKDDKMSSEEVENSYASAEEAERRPRPRHVDTTNGKVKPYPSSTFAPKNKIRVYRNGCGLKLRQWLDYVSGNLFILGFCIIGFIKVCFLIILRYEIREMIEKIQILGTEKKVVTGPGGLNSPPLYNGGRLGPRQSIQKQFSTQSGGQLHPAGITIKSPQGDSVYYNSLSNYDSMPHYQLHHHPPHHHSHHVHAGRRHSARSLGEPSYEVRRKSHSQETVNMTLLITNHHNHPTSFPQEPTRKEGEAEETISLKVPTPEEREAKRANFAHHCTWDSNVSGDSSMSGAYCASLTYEPCCCPAEAGSASCGNHKRTQLVEVDMEKGGVSNGSSLEERSASPLPSFLQRHESSGEGEDGMELLPLRRASNPNARTPSLTCAEEVEENSPRLDLSWPPGKTEDGEADGRKKVSNSSLAISTASSQSPPSTTSNSRVSLLMRRNGNNNSATSSIEIDLDSDFVMGLIGTAV